MDVLAIYGRQFQVIVPALISYSRGADGLVALCGRLWRLGAGWCGQRRPRGYDHIHLVGEHSKLDDIAASISARYAGAHLHVTLGGHRLTTLRPTTIEAALREMPPQTARLARGVRTEGGFHDGSARGELPVRDHRVVHRLQRHRRSENRRHGPLQGARRRHRPHRARHRRRLVGHDAAERGQRRRIAGRVIALGVDAPTGAILTVRLPAHHVAAIGQRRDGRRELIIARISVDLELGSGKAQLRIAELQLLDLYQGVRPI